MQWQRNYQVVWKVSRVKGWKYRNSEFNWRSKQLLLGRYLARKTTWTSEEWKLSFVVYSTSVQGHRKYFVRKKTNRTTHTQKQSRKKKMESCKICSWLYKSVSPLIWYRSQASANQPDYRQLFYTCQGRVVSCLTLCTTQCQIGDRWLPCSLKVLSSSLKWFWEKECNFK